MGPLINIVFLEEFLLARKGRNLVEHFCMVTENIRVASELVSVDAGCISAIEFIVRDMFVSIWIVKAWN